MLRAAELSFVLRRLCAVTTVIESFTMNVMLSHRDKRAHTVQSRAVQPR